MGVELDHTSVVILANWNPAIISPSWLERHKVVEEVPEELNFGFQPLGRSFRFALGDLVWQVNEARLEIKSQKGKDCGSVAARVLNLLPHTPVQAIGTNFVFHCPRQDWPSKYLPHLGEIRGVQGEEASKFEQTQWFGVRKLEENTRFQVTVTEQVDHDVVVAANLHRNVADAKKAADLVGNWAGDRDTALEMMKDMFGVDFPWPH